MESCVHCPNYERLYPQSIFRMEAEHIKHKSCGLMIQHHQKGLAYDVAKAIGHPIVVLQKIPEICKCDLFFQRKKSCELCANIESKCPHAFCEHMYERERYLRLDASDILVKNFSSLCREIRKDNDPGEYDVNISQVKRGEYTNNYNACRCYNLDCIAAEYYLGDKEKATQALGHSLRERHVLNGRSYISYICPYSGYTECAFMLEYCGLSAVLVSGQFLVEDGTTESSTNIEKNKMLCEKYGIKQKRDIISNENLDDTAVIIFNEIDKMIERFDGIYETRSRYFTSKHISDAIQRITDFGTIISQKPTDEQYNDLKSTARNCIIEFADKSGITQIDCFMTMYLDDQYSTILVNDVGEQIDDRIIKRHKILEAKLVEISKLEDDISYFSGITDFSKYTHLIFSPNAQLFNMLVLLQIKSENTKNYYLINAYEYYFKTIETAVRAVALGYYYKYQTNMIERFAKELRHELGQHNAGFLANISVFEKTINNCNDNEKDKRIRNIIRNARSYAHATMLRANTSRYMRGTPDPKKDHFYPYSAFLFKWSEVYYDYKDSLKIRFKIFNPEKNDRNRPQMFADSDMMEQAAYNLTNNAMKYGLPGTRATLDCRLNDNRDMYELIVTNYGFPMKDKKEYNQVFDRGFQGSNSINIIEESDGNINDLNKDSGGLGLALTREIAEKHDGKLNMYVDEISNLCVPYFASYLEMYSRLILRKAQEQYGALPDLRQDIKAETDRLQRENITYWQELNEITILSSEEYIIPPSVIIDAIRRGVVKYTFVISIPHKEIGVNLDEYFFSRG